MSFEEKMAAKLAAKQAAAEADKKTKDAVVMAAQNDEAEREAEKTQKQNEAVEKIKSSAGYKAIEDFTNSSDFKKALDAIAQKFGPAKYSKNGFSFKRIVALRRSEKRFQDIFYCEAQICSREFKVTCFDCEGPDYPEVSALVFCASLTIKDGVITYRIHRFLMDYKVFETTSAEVFLEEIALRLVNVEPRDVYWRKSAYTGLPEDMA